MDEQMARILEEFRQTVRIATFQEVLNHMSQLDKEEYISDTYRYRATRNYLRRMLKGLIHE